jgi:hypothetical protein
MQDAREGREVSLKSHQSGKEEVGGLWEQRPEGTAESMGKGTRQEK